MPTPRKAATPLTATTPDTDIDNEIPPPTWDTSEDTRSAWLQELDRWLPGQYPEYTTLIESGFITERRIVCCMSDNHIDRIRQGCITKGTWLRPARISRNEIILEGLPVLTPDELAADRNSSDRKRYEIAPESIATADRRMFETVLGTIQDKDAPRFEDICIR